MSFKEGFRNSYKFWLGGELTEPDNLFFYVGEFVGTISEIVLLPILILIKLIQIVSNEGERK